MKDGSTRCRCRLQSLGPSDALDHVPSILAVTYFFVDQGNDARPIELAVYALHNLLDAELSAIPIPPLSTHLRQRTTSRQGRPCAGASSRTTSSRTQPCSRGRLGYLGKLTSETADLELERAVCLILRKDGGPRLKVMIIGFTDSSDQQALRLDPGNATKQLPTCQSDFSALYIARAPPLASLSLSKRRHTQPPRLDISRNKQSSQQRLSQRYVSLYIKLKFSTAASTTTPPTSHPGCVFRNDVAKLID